MLHSSIQGVSRNADRNETRLSYIVLKINSNFFNSLKSHTNVPILKNLSLIGSYYHILVIFAVRTAFRLKARVYLQLVSKYNKFGFPIQNSLHKGLIKNTKILSTIPTIKILKTNLKLEYSTKSIDSLLAE